MSELWAVLLGGSLALVGSLVATVFSGRQERTAAARGERLNVYAGALPALESLIRWQSRLSKLYGVTSEDPLAKAMLSPFNGNPDIGAAAKALADDLEHQMQVRAPKFYRLDLIAGTPVSAEMHRLLFPARTIPGSIRMWLLAGNEPNFAVKDPGEFARELSLSISNLADGSLHKITRLMREDLADPWLPEIDDKSTERRYRLRRRR